jgi:uncharacterized protein (DUF1778 family)
MAARGSGSSIDADARNTEFFMAGLSDGCNGLTKNTPTDRSVADAYDIGFGAGQEDRRRGQGRPTDLPMHMKKVFQRAADIRHQTLTEFVLGSAYDRAITTILDDAVLCLSERDGEAFASALSEPGPIKEAVLARFQAASESDRPRATLENQVGRIDRTRQGREARRPFARGRPLAH